MYYTEEDEIIYYIGEGLVPVNEIVEVGGLKKALYYYMKKTKRNFYLFSLGPLPLSTYTKVTSNIVLNCHFLSQIYDWLETNDIRLLYFNDRLQLDVLISDGNHPLRNLLPVYNAILDFYDWYCQRIEVLDPFDYDDRRDPDIEAFEYDYRRNYCFLIELAKLYNLGDILYDLTQPDVIPITKYIRINNNDIDIDNDVKLFINKLQNLKDFISNYLSYKNKHKLKVE